MLCGLSFCLGRGRVAGAEEGGDEGWMWEWAEPVQAPDQTQGQLEAIFGHVGPGRAAGLQDKAPCLCPGSSPTATCSRPAAALVFVYLKMLELGTVFLKRGQRQMPSGCCWEETPWLSSLPPGSLAFPWPGSAVGSRNPWALLLLGPRFREGGVTALCPAEKTGTSSDVVQRNHPRSDCWSLSAHHPGRGRRGCWTPRSPPSDTSTKQRCGHLGASRLGPLGFGTGVWWPGRVWSLPQEVETPVSRVLCVNPAHPPPRPSAHLGAGFRG